MSVEIAAYCGLRGTSPPPNPSREWRKLHALYLAVCGANGKKFPGLDDVAALMLLCYIGPDRKRGAARRHVLLEGAAGTAKTELTKAVAEALECYTSGLQNPTDTAHARIQGTPDLLPSAFVGYEARKDANTFEFHDGDMLKNSTVYHVDEINRIPSRTLSVLLEAMAEGQVTLNSLLVPAANRRRKLPWLFVVGTQNPGSFIGTNALPEPLLDRFMVRVIMPYPEQELLSGLLHSLDATASASLNPNQIKLRVNALRKLLARIVGKAGTPPADRNVDLARDVAAILLASWPLEAASLIPNLLDQIPHQRRLRALVDDHLEYGLGVRAGQALRDLSSVVAWSRTGGRLDATVTRRDVEAVAPFVLSHRLRVKAGRCTQMDFVRRWLQQVWQWRDSA